MGFIDWLWIIYTGIYTARIKQKTPTILWFEFLTRFVLNGSETFSLEKCPSKFVEFE